MLKKTSEILKILQSDTTEKYSGNMEQFGIKADKFIGVKVPELRRIAKAYKHDHDLALDLWKSGIHEARIMAGIIDEPEKVTKQQIRKWVSEIESWDICDQLCINLIIKLPYCLELARSFTASKHEFTRRAGFVIYAVHAVHMKKEPNETYINFFPYIEKHCTDKRNFVKKGVNWALRQIGKKNLVLKKASISFAETILKIEDPTARWIASDALKELRKK